MKTTYSDQELRYTAEQVANTMLSSLPTPQECERSFSEDFQEKMEPLRRKSRHMTAVRKVRQRVAVVVLAVLLSVSTWLTVDAEARERVIQWAKEIYESIIVYTFDSGINTDKFPVYEPTWIPEGLLLVEDSCDATSRLWVYMDETGRQMVVIQYTFMDNTSMNITAQDLTTILQVDINGQQADFYGGSGGSEDKTLIWVNETKNVVFTIQGNLPDIDMLHIARSIALSDSTKQQYFNKICLKRHPLSVLFSKTGTERG